MERPLEGQCPVCNNVFIYKQRMQGGGRRTIYCSSKCRSLDWIRGNGGKRKASVLKYDNKPDNKLKKRERTRKARLKKYDWSEDDFEQALLGQNGKCLGCQSLIGRYTARIDHCHESNQTRGLLCDNCNWALGHTKDSIRTLGRLIEYLCYWEFSQSTGTCCS